MGERFIDYYQGRVPLVDPSGQERLLEARSFRDVRQAFRRGGSHAAGRWSVRSLARVGAVIPFRGSFRQLFTWSRHEGLLHGQRSRLFDRAMVNLRNSVAHRPSYLLTSPVESARLIWEIAEIINRLWGDRTPGGRIFPLPAERHIFALGWAPDGTTIRRSWADQVGSSADTGWTYVVVRAVEADEELFRFDSEIESSHFPVDLLWGPGNQDEAVAWLAQEQPVGDTVEYLDRRFLIRVENGKVDPPRNQAQFLALDPSQRSGTWHLVEADVPDDAFVHARSLALGAGDCIPCGPCPNCWATSIAAEDWAAIKSQLPSAAAALPKAHVRVPEHFRRWS
jgi:hypothetical protein